MPRRYNPAPDVAMDYVRSFGIDPNKVRDNWTREGYWLLVGGRLSSQLDDRDFRWFEWPQGFDVDYFDLLMTRGDALSPLDAVLQALAGLNHRLQPFGVNVSLMIDVKTFDPIGVIREARLVPLASIPEGAIKPVAEGGA